MALLALVIAVAALILAFAAFVQAHAMRCFVRHLQVNEDGTVHIPDEMRDDRQRLGGSFVCRYVWQCHWTWWPPGQTCQYVLVCD